MLNLSSSGIAARFLATQQGRIFLLGCSMAAMWLATSTILWWFGHDGWLVLMIVGLANLLLGKAGGVAQGMQADVPGRLVVLVLAYTDAMFALIVYPLFVFSYQHYVESRFFRRHMKLIFESAHRNVDRFAHFKVAGIFLFVWAPFMMTGVAIGSILGFLLGLRTWVTLTTVILASLTASVVWVYAFDRVYAWLGSVNEVIPATLTAAIVVALVLLRYYQKRSIHRDTEN